MPPLVALALLLCCSRAARKSMSAAECGVMVDAVALSTIAKLGPIVRTSSVSDSDSSLFSNTVSKTAMPLLRATCLCRVLSM